MPYSDDQNESVWERKSGSVGEKESVRPRKTTIFLYTVALLCVFGGWYCDDDDDGWYCIKSRLWRAMMMMMMIMLGCRCDGVDMRETGELSSWKGHVYVCVLCACAKMFIVSKENYLCKFWQHKYIGLTTTRRIVCDIYACSYPIRCTFFTHHFKYKKKI